MLQENFSFIELIVNKGFIIHPVKFPLNAPLIPLLFLDQLLKKAFLNILRLFPSLQNGLRDGNLSISRSKQTGFILLIPIVPIGAVQIERASPKTSSQQRYSRKYVTISYTNAVRDGIWTNAPDDAWGNCVLIP